MSFVKSCVRVKVTVTVRIRNIAGTLLVCCCWETLTNWYTTGLEFKIGIQNRKAAPQRMDGETSAVVLGCCRGVRWRVCGSARVRTAARRDATNNKFYKKVRVAARLWGGYLNNEVHVVQRVQRQPARRLGSLLPRKSIIVCVRGRGIVV